MRPISRPKKDARFRAPEDGLRAAVIGDGPVDQSGAVREQQMLADEPKMMLRLLRREQSADDAAGHRQQRIFKTRARVAWMQQQLGPSTAGLEKAIAGNRIVADRESD